MTIYEKLIKAGVPMEDIGNWRSDLYVRRSHLADPIVKKHMKQFPLSVSMFKSEIDGTPHWEVMFAYDPFWKEKTK